MTEAEVVNENASSRSASSSPLKVKNGTTPAKSSSSSGSSPEKKRGIPKDIRIAVIGNVDSGKSTMIGVLTSGELDDGRGSARLKILRHNHEKSNGRTSCSSQHILGFSSKRKPVHQPISISAKPQQKTTAWSQVFKTSHKIITFIDLAGHERYLKTTISGLTGCFPDYAFIVVGANRGITKMTTEHIQVAVALSIPLFVVITKIDNTPEKILKTTVKQLVKLLRSSACNNKMAMIIRKKKEIKLVLEKDQYLERICPIFCVSAVTGDNMEKVNYFLSHLKPRKPWKHNKETYVVPETTEEHKSKAENTADDTNNNNNSDANTNTNPNPAENESRSKADLATEMHGELEIDETFAVRGVGIVVSGTVTSGRIFPNQKLFLGPFSDSSFKEIVLRSVHQKRCIVNDAREGESCSVSFRFVKRREVVDRIMIRKGMVAVSDESSKPRPVWAFTATILVLHHPTTINEGYQPVVHCGNIRQTATIMKMSRHRLRSGDSSLVDMKFLCHPEYLHTNRPIIIREGSTKCIGKVIQLYPQYHPSLSDFTQLAMKLNMSVIAKTHAHQRQNAANAHANASPNTNHNHNVANNQQSNGNNASNRAVGQPMNNGNTINNTNAVNSVTATNALDSVNTDAYSRAFDEHRITKEDLHALEEEMAQLKLQQKVKKLKKKKLKELQLQQQSEAQAQAQTQAQTQAQNADVDVDVSANNSNANIDNAGDNNNANQRNVESGAQQNQNQNESGNSNNNAVVNNDGALNTANTDTTTNSVTTANAVD